MKKISILVCCLVGSILFIAAVKKNDPPALHSLEGVWELKHQYLFENNEITDTLFDLNGKRQVKIYSKGKVMWARYSPSDINEWFGYGSYEIVDGMLEEHLEFASIEMMKIVDTVQVFRFVLEMGNNKYSQISLDAKGNKYNSENYEKIE